MMTETYGGERATVHAPADSSTDTVLRFGEGVGYNAYRMEMPVERAAALAARWNACADALDVLDEPTVDEMDDSDLVMRAAAILRRAIYGDESR
jgi:hypothetical protein